LQTAGLELKVRPHSTQGLLFCACQTPQRQKKLFCRYHHGNRTPQLLIAPFKEEDEWDSPHIVRYYDVMSDEEIERIKEIAKPKVGISVGPSRALKGIGSFISGTVGQFVCLLSLTSV
jgi:hypothetical protein